MAGAVLVRRLLYFGEQKLISQWQIPRGEWTVQQSEQHAWLLSLWWRWRRWQGWRRWQKRCGGGLRCANFFHFLTIAWRNTRWFFGNAHCGAALKDDDSAEPILVPHVSRVEPPEQFSDRSGPIRGMNGSCDWRGFHRMRERKPDATGGLDVAQHLSQRAFVELNVDSLRSYCRSLGQ